MHMTPKHARPASVGTVGFEFVGHFLGYDFYWQKSTRIMWRVFEDSNLQHSLSSYLTVSSEEMEMGELDRSRWVTKLREKIASAYGLAIRCLNSAQNDPSISPNSKINF